MESSQAAGLQNQVNIRDVFSIIWRRLWLIVLIIAVAIATSYIVTKYTHKVYQATARLQLIERVSTNGNSQYPVASSATVETQSDIVRQIESIGTARRVIYDLEKQATDKGLTPDTVGVTDEQLLKVISVEPLKDSHLIEVTVEADSPDKAVLLANTVCHTFEKYKTDMVADRNNQDLTTLQGRVERAKAQLADANGQVVAYKRSHQVVDVPAQQKVLLEEYLKRDADVSGANEELAAQQQNLSRLAQQLKISDHEIESGGVQDTTVITSLQAQLADMTNQMTVLQARYNDQNPDVRALAAKIQDVKGRLSVAVKDALSHSKPTLESHEALFQAYTQAQTTIYFTKAKLQASIRQRDRLNAQLGTVPQSEVDYARLQRNADVASDLYAQQMAMLNQFQINMMMSQGNVVVQEEAYPQDKPVRPDPLRNYLFGSAVGIFLSVVSVLLMEQLDRRVRSVVHIRKVVQGPVIGSLPRMSRAEIRQLSNGEESQQAVEAYSLARANLNLAMRDTKAYLTDGTSGQVMLVTSAVPGEGKSLTAAEMSKSMARAGRSTILVDADLRRPTQNALFNTDEKHGLAEVLTGSMTLDEAIVATEIENLSILHAGSAKRNPTDLISSTAMVDVIRDLRKEADTIILDAPACSVVADALLMAPFMDCILYVIGSGQVDEHLARETIEALKVADPKTMVFFINRAPKERSHSYKYYHYYHTGFNGKNGSATAGSNGRTTKQLPRWEPANKTREETRKE